jgi:hypothetical protein
MLSIYETAIFATGSALLLIPSALVVTLPLFIGVLAISAVHSFKDSE